MSGAADEMGLLVLMAKQPLPGRTKTRLTPPLTAEGAASLYQAFLQDKVAQMRLVSDVKRAIAYAPADGRNYFAELAPDFELIEQEGEALTIRLINVFNQAFERGHSRVMAIDGDTPTLPPGYLQQGFVRLEDPEVDVVLGPSADGGYYAIGMKKLWQSLFDVTMSTPQVTRDTLANAEAAGLRVLCLPQWWDVDRPADLEKLKTSLRASGAQLGYSAPATLKLLRSGGSWNP